MGNSEKKPTVSLHPALPTIRGRIRLWVTTPDLLKGLIPLPLQCSDKGVANTYSSQKDFVAQSLHLSSSVQKICCPTPCAEQGRAVECPRHRSGEWLLYNTGVGSGSVTQHEWSATQHEWRCSDTEVDKGNVNVSASGQRTNCNAKSKVSQEALCLVKS